jgi:nucleotide-binding universal stress UspA family protein
VLRAKNLAPATTGEKLTSQCERGRFGLFGRLREACGSKQIHHPNEPRSAFLINSLISLLLFRYVARARLSGAARNGRYCKVRCEFVKDFRRLSDSSLDRRSAAVGQTRMWSGAGTRSSLNEIFASPEYRIEPGVMKIDGLAKPPSSRDLRVLMPDHYNLLLYYDGSPESRSALLRVTRLGNALAATVHVLSVVDIDSVVGYCIGFVSDMACRHLEDEANRVLNEALQHLGDSGIVARGHVAAGNVVDNMARFAGLLNADLLVLGHRNPRGLASWFSNLSRHAALVERAVGRVVITVPLD